MAADLACAIAGGSEVISDFRVLADQKELFGLVASMPTTWLTLDEIATWSARGALTRIALPGVRIADKVLEGVTCIRLDATVTPAHSDKELAEPSWPHQDGS